MWRTREYSAHGLDEPREAPLRGPQDWYSLDRNTFGENESHSTVIRIIEDGEDTGSNSTNTNQRNLMVLGSSGSIFQVPHILEYTYN